MTERIEDKLEFQNGVPGLWGASGKFHPITTDMGVEITGHESTGVRLVSTIPEGMVVSSDLPERHLSLNDIARFFLGAMHVKDGTQ